MSPSSEQYAQLASMFTTVEEDANLASIELLLPAHLPVQGALWLVPYAGRETLGGMSILVRMHENTIDVAAIGNGNIDLTDCNCLEDVIRRVGGESVHWIVQPPTDADPTSLLHCDADRVTLLSGADQAAVVGAYRLLKGLISASGDDSIFPPIRLVIVGAEERAANEAAGRIVQTSHHQLGVTVEIGQPLPAMGSSSNVISQVSFNRGSNVVDLMCKIRNSEKEEEQLQPTQRFEHLSEPVVVVPEKEAPFEMPVETEEVEFETQEVKSYTSYVDGLLEISPRCPEHEHVELAVDSNGCLHVLANSNDLRDAAIVSSWVVRHYKLIAMACGGVKINKSNSPVQHLFADVAVSVADLHGSGIRLHLLTEVEVDGKVGTFCVPLN